MEPTKRRRAIYVATAIIGALIVILAVLLLQQPIQPKTTPPPTTITPPVVSTAAATAVGQTEAILNGNLKDLGTASSVTVGFLYSTDSALAGATNITVSSQTATVAFNHTVSGLSPGTTYFFQAWADGDGFSIDAIYRFSTLTETTPQVRSPSVTTDAASSVSTESATLNGNLGDLGTASSVTIGFRYGTDASLAGATNLSLGAQTATGAFDDAVTGLSTNTTYYVEAWALGDGYASGSILSFKTTAEGAGNGHHVPPGWAHAACPDVPERAPAHGVRARCLHNETWGQMKKDMTGDSSAVIVPPNDVTHGPAARTSDPGRSASHRSSNSYVG